MSAAELRDRILDMVRDYRLGVQSMSNKSSVDFRCGPLVATRVPQVIEKCVVR